VTAALIEPRTVAVVGWRPVVALARIEARRYATRASVWLGWVGTVATAVFARPDWPGAAYEQVVPVSFAALALGTFVAGVRTGGRDLDTDAGPLAEEAALGGDARAAARLLGLAAPVALALITAVAIAVVAGVEGGFWMGEGARRTDSASHSAAELIQPVLIVALAGAAGVMLGRKVSRSVLAITLGVFVWTALFPLYWMWNGDRAYPVALVQTMPLRVPIPGVTGLADTPADWWVESPNSYRADFVRDVVHLPTVVLHDLYLAGMLTLVAAGSLPRRRVAVRAGGAAVAVAAALAQWAVSPL
jgi:hypothetical protein